MDEKLREELSNMTDEDFYEVKRNMDISSDLRDLMRGEEPFTEAEIMKRLDFTQFDLLYVFNGAFDFTTRHMAIIDVMREEHEWLNSDADGSEAEEDDKNEEVDIADRDMPDMLNYGIFENEEIDEIIEVGNSRQLSTAEMAELENDDKKDIADAKENKEETMEELGNRLNREYLEKMAEQNKVPEKNTDPSIVTFD